MTKKAERIHLAPILLVVFIFPSALALGLFDEWTTSLGGGWDGAPRVHDLNMDGKAEIVAVARGSPPVLECLDFDGTEKWHSVLKGSRATGVSLGDLDGDGRLDVVAAVSGPPSAIFAFDATGKVLWEIALEGKCTSNPIVVDVDWDGRDEVLVSDEGRGLLCIDGLSGGIRWTVAKRMPYSNVIIVADLERTGGTEVLWFLNKTGSLWVIEAEKGEVLGKLEGSQEQQYFGWPLIGDMDADGHLDLVIATEHNVICLDPVNLTTKWKANLASRYAGALGDVDGDGYLEALIPGNGLVACLEANGSIRYESQVEEGGWVGSIVLADLNGDGHQEALFAPDRSQVLYGLDASTGFVEFSYASYMGGVFPGSEAAAIADGDADRTAEVYIGVTNQTPAPFYALSTGERSGSLVEWPQYLHDWRGTGNYETTIQTASESLIALAAFILGLGLLLATERREAREAPCLAIDAPMAGRCEDRYKKRAS